jgi:hypothetical protein
MVVCQKRAKNLPNAGIQIIFNNDLEQPPITSPPAAAFLREAVE